VRARAGGRACLSGERLLFAHVRGRDAVVLRLAGLYGEGRVPRMAGVVEGRPIAGSPDAYLDLIHVEDAARAVVTAAALGPVAGRTYNVSDGRLRTRGSMWHWWPGGCECHRRCSRAGVVWASACETTGSSTN